MGIGRRDAPAGSGYVNTFEHLDGPPHRGGPIAPDVRGQRLGDLVADRPDRVERAEWVLIDEPDLGAADAPQLRVRLI